MWPYFIFLDKAHFHGAILDVSLLSHLWLLTPHLSEMKYSPDGKSNGGER